MSSKNSRRLKRTSNLVVSSSKIRKCSMTTKDTSTFSPPTKDMNPVDGGFLSHHPRNAARPVPWRLDRAPEVAVRDGHAVARAAIGPGAAAVLGLTGVDAGLGLGIGGRFE